MDYELKYVIAICLIVKIAALSPEFSINEETGKLKQIPTRVEGPVSSPSVADEQYSRRMVFKWGSEREKLDEVNNKKGVAKTQRIIENQSFNTCEHKLKLLQSSLKWRDIRKTLRWLERIIVSNQTNFQLCPARKEQKQAAPNGSHPSNTEFRKFFKMKKPTWVRNNSRENQKSKKEHWKLRSRKGSKKSKDFVYPAVNSTILKPNSVLSEFEKMFIIKKTKIKNHPCNFVKNCEPTHKEWEAKNHTEKFSPNPKIRENKAKSGKPKSWPHFVYHRVSSNFLHPELPGQSHGKSAYIAISVVNGGKSDSTDNNI